MGINDGSAILKNCRRAEALAAKKPKAGSTLYVVDDPNKAAKSRLIKAVKGEGMPTHKNPFVCGNLFLILNIVFPKELDPAAVTALKKILSSRTRRASTVTERMRTTRTKRGEVFRAASACSATSSELFFVSSPGPGRAGVDGR